MITDWREDKNWADGFIPEIKQILGEHLIGEAAREDDAEKNTDLIVLKLEAVRIACRIRQNIYLANFGNEFTIRSGRPTGIKTELAKIIEGWGDYFFYGFADENSFRLARWTLIDLKVFRLWLWQCFYRDKILPGIEKKNADNSSTFFVFNFAKMAQEIIFASSWK